jgi:UPF0176 protein
MTTFDLVAVVIMSSGQPPIVVAALYKFVPLPDYRELQGRLGDFCRARGIKGTLLLAEEGINGTLAGPRAGIDAVLDYLKADPRLADLEHKESYTDQPPFLRMKVKLKKEIVTLGVPNINPQSRVGHYVEPGDWNALVSDPEVLLIDTRNDYECGIGTFKGAVNPHTGSFREFPGYVRRSLDPKQHKKIAMFCTGGIRCEKATSYLLSQGFEEVYHLKGGILKYLETVPKEESLWEGECFVFDSRVAVDHGLAGGSYDQCHACRHPVSEEDKASEFYEPGVKCPHCHDKKTEEQRAGAAERYRQEHLARSRNEKHVGAEMRRRLGKVAG